MSPFHLCYIVGLTLSLQVRLQTFMFVAACFILSHFCKRCTVHLATLYLCVAVGPGVCMAR